MDVGRDEAFFGGTRRLLGSACDAFFTKDVFGFAQVAIGLHQGPFAIHHAGVGLVTQLLDEGWVDFSHTENVWVRDECCVFSRAPRSSLAESSLVSDEPAED